MMTDLKTAQEERVVFAFRNMDERRKDEVLRYMERQAESFPMHPRVHLQLVDVLIGDAATKPVMPLKRRSKAPKLRLV